MQTKKRKYYFKDYTQHINLSKKIKEFLDKNKKEVFHYKELGKSLKKKNLYNQPKTYKDKDGNEKYFKSSLINEEIFFRIEKSFGILQELGYIENFDFEHLPKQDSYLIHVKYTDELREFYEVLKNSIYYPVKGEKQKITDELRKEIEAEYSIDYQVIKNKNSVDNDYIKTAQSIEKELKDIWMDQYIKMTAKQTFIHKVESDFTFLFDVQSYSEDEDFMEDRIVVTYGFSKKSKVKRDTSRLAGYLRGSWNWTDKETDKGHFIGHSLGGHLDENIFPQKKDINRGHSARGKVYRKMEQYCADNEGTFCFSRPIYCDFSLRPYVIEYGVLKQDGTLWVESFDNV